VALVSLHGFGGSGGSVLQWGNGRKALMLTGPGQLDKVWGRAALTLAGGGSLVVVSDEAWGGGACIPKLHQRRGAALVLHGFRGGGTGAHFGGR
jgi:hypothetical protein